MSCEVFCVGNAVADVLARPVDHLAPRGTSQALEDVALAPGGNCVNTSIALARLGVSVGIAAAIGNDRFGQFIRDRIRAEGIDDAGLVTLHEAKTSTSIVLVETTGERRFLHLRGVSAFFTGQNLDWRGGEGARIFHYASAFAMPAFDETSLEPALRRARERGCLTSLNICWDVRGRWIKTLMPALAHTDFIFPNCEEGRQLTGESEPAAIASRLRQWGVKTVVVKLGAAGCYVESPEGSFTSQGFSVQPVDTTGAGDCFAAGFLAALCRGQSLALAARFANATGAFATLGLGAADSAPTIQQLENFLRRHASKSDAPMPQ
ncbi:MAG TPA: carbohydrate kinase family protein [Terriglobia bacterium]|nr:carbohydrate kinase family protein [Terriglobia bacterium]